MTKAIGFIEVRGYLGAVAALDTALKAANVNHLNLEKISGGFSTVKVNGDVAAVTAAIEAGKREAERLSCLLSAHVIARADEQIEKLLMNDKTETSKIAEREDEVFVSTDERKEQGKQIATAVINSAEKITSTQKEKKSKQEKNKGKGGGKK